jgi:aspartate aminotransferase
VGAVAPSPTLAVDAKAKAMRRAGVDVVSFGAGEPDFPTPTHVVEAAAAACADPATHKYSPTGGLPELKEAIVWKTRRDSGLEATVEEVLVTNGAKQAIYEAFATLLDPGDEVLLPTPCWSTYAEAAKLAGARVVWVPTSEASGFHLEANRVAQAIGPATRLLVLVSPSNPTGAVLSEEELAAIGRVVADAGLWVLTDEMYEHLVYDGRSAPSLPVVAPETRARCVVVNGVSKTYAMTGWRVGWMIGPTDVIAAATDLQSQLSSNVANVAQRAALAALEGGLEALSKMREAFDRRRRRIVAGLNACRGVRCALPEGAFYAFPSVQDVLGKQIAGRSIRTSMDLATVAIEEAAVALVPGEAFFAPGYLRMSYALGDEELDEGLRRLEELLATAE